MGEIYSDFRVGGTLFNKTTFRSFQTFEYPTVKNLPRKRVFLLYFRFIIIVHGFFTDFSFIKILALRKKIYTFLTKSEEQRIEIIILVLKVFLPLVRVVCDTNIGNY